MMSFFTAKKTSEGRPAKGSASSSTVAIATATLFVLVTAALGLAMDRHAPPRDDVGGGWRLRGALESIVVKLPPTTPA